MGVIRSAFYARHEVLSEKGDDLLHLVRCEKTASAIRGLLGRTGGIGTQSRSSTKRVQAGVWSWVYIWPRG